MVTSHIGISSLNSCFPSLPRLPRPCFTKRKPFAVAAMSDDPVFGFYQKEMQPRLHGPAPLVVVVSTMQGVCWFFLCKNKQVGPLPTSGSYIMMEFIEFGVCRGNQFVLGRKLAEMHQASLFENIDRAILTSWRLVEWEYQL